MTFYSILSSCQWNSQHCQIPLSRVIRVVLVNSEHMKLPPHSGCIFICVFPSCTTAEPCPRPGPDFALIWWPSDKLWQSYYKSILFLKRPALSNTPVDVSAWPTVLTLAVRVNLPAYYTLDYCDSRPAQYLPHFRLQVCQCQCSQGQIFILSSWTLFETWQDKHDTLSMLSVLWMPTHGDQ